MINLELCILNIYNIHTLRQSGCSIGAQVIGSMPAALRLAPEDAFPVCGGFFLLSRWSLRGHNDNGNRENPLRSH